MTEIAIVGRWAKEKLDALGRYLDFYTKVLKNQRWRTIYVDAFAGGGRAVVRPDAKCAPAGLLLFEAEEVDADQRELIDGSPRVALNVANPFDSYLFIDPDPGRGRELDALRQEYQSQRNHYGSWRQRGERHRAARRAEHFAADPPRDRFP